MQNKIFHNHIFYEKNLKKEKLTHLYNTNKKKIVDINKLLNRVTLEEQNKKKQKYIFLSFGLLLLGSMALFVSIIK